ncbi:MAG: pseudouridine synthase, partial [Crocinitomicaceae bacterium]|nr:pseudouridine synthase [Crocinitomicaceae bacterium]
VEKPAKQIKVDNPEESTPKLKSPSIKKAKDPKPEEVINVPVEVSKKKSAKPVEKPAKKIKPDNPENPLTSTAKLSESKANQDNVAKPKQPRPRIVEEQAPVETNTKSATESANPENLNTKIRLNKYLAKAGVCSRREADTLITKGLVSVNGEVITELGVKVKKSDKICYKDKLLTLEQLRYILLNKPKDSITTMEDTHDRRTVMELVENACEERIYPVGRLDRMTTGLLLLTNDGGLAKKLTHPSHQIKKIYLVELNREVDTKDMSALLEGVELEDGITKFDTIQFDQKSDEKSIVIVSLHSGKNRIVRRMFAQLNYRVDKLDRISFAGVTKGNLHRGKWRFLSEKEIGFLKML